MLSSERTSFASTEQWSKTVTSKNMLYDLTQGIQSGPGQNCSYKCNSIPSPSPPSPHKQQERKEETDCFGEVHVCGIQQASVGPFFPFIPSITGCRKALIGLVCLIKHCSQACGDCTIIPFFIVILLFFLSPDAWRPWEDWISLFNKALFTRLYYNYIFVLLVPLPTTHPPF